MFLDIRNLPVIVSEIYDDIWGKKNITLSLLRLDMIHPVISGNKLFKLYYFLQKAVESNLKIITFGGAYSNHLVATTLACKLSGLQCIGIVRGEKPTILSHSLLYCLEKGMQLEFISRSAYDQRDEIVFDQDLHSKFGDHVLIPEGGFSEDGVRGASEIYKYIANKPYTHICCAVGTATTLAGLLKATELSQQLIGFSALKEINFQERLNLLSEKPLPANCQLIENYHFGGYAKKSDHLISFMNTFYEDHSIPLDFVYTGKMMYGVVDMIKQNFFPAQSNIICIHTGGLQGNASLIPGMLRY